MNLDVTYHIRKFGHRYITDTKDKVFVEDDSNEQEIKQQINWYFRKYHDNDQIVEYHNYTIKQLK